MPGHMKKHLTSDTYEIIVKGNDLQRFLVHRKDVPRILNSIKKSVILDDGYVIDNETMTADEFFKSMGVDYSKPGMIVRDCRIRDDLTQEELAKKLAILQTHVSEIENNKRPIGKALAKKLAKVFNINYRMFL